MANEAGQHFTISSSDEQSLPRRGLLWRSVMIWLTVIFLAEILASGITWPRLIQEFQVLSSRTSSLTAPAQAKALFYSSELLGNISSSRGITDELLINLQNVPTPQSGKSYYAWLLSDNGQVPALFLGTLVVEQTQVNFSYIGIQHNNLLANYNSFLITEEPTNITPAIPSPDKRNWRYSAAFPTTPNPADTVNHFSVFDHLRHLLAQDPKLQAVGLGGGLDIWLFRNVLRVVEQTGSARDTQKLCASGDSTVCDFVRRALVRVLDYLDGSTYVQADVPPNTQLLIDPTIARVALLEFDQVHQQPPGYLDHIGTHLRELASSPGVTAQQRTLAIGIGQAINNVQARLEAVHTDAKQLVNMNDSQLSQPAALSLLDDMLTQAQTALFGTSTTTEGVAQIHYNIQGLATFDVMPCTITNGKNPCS